MLSLPHLPGLAYALGQPVVQANIRQSAEDFQVDEDLGFAPDGSGEHIMLHVRKRHTNTEWLARQIARFYGVKPMDVSYAGLKDRLAVTTQWFSVHLPKSEEPDAAGLNNEEVEILQAVRHQRKLRRGTLRGNRFVLVLRDVSGDKADLEQRLQNMQAVPNYFGAQRFGHDEQNLVKAASLLTGEIKVKDRHKRGMYISSARSFLFNQILSLRVASGAWQQALAGDVMQLDGSHSLFDYDSADAEIPARLAAMDVHPTGPLWGRGRLRVQADTLALEQDCLQQWAELLNGLEHVGLEQERRSLRLPVRDWAWEWLDETSLRLQFFLPAGAYASAVLRELCLSQEPEVGD